MRIIAQHYLSLSHCELIFTNYWNCDEIEFIVSNLFERLIYHKRIGFSFKSQQIFGENEPQPLIKKKGKALQYSNKIFYV